MSRDYTVVVLGATGFTGRLVCKYMASQVANGRFVGKWAIAGRNQTKLSDLCSALALNVPTLYCDTSDVASLEAIASNAKVILTCVGPYKLYGAPVVKACVEHGTQYCDITGEPYWIKEMIDAYHTKAIENKSVIVHSCGFDSVPSDMGTWFIHRVVRELGGNLGLVKSFFWMKGGISGGTIATAAHAFGNPKDVAPSKHPYSLMPERTAFKRGDEDQYYPRKEDGFWSTIFVMANGNSRLVRRSAAFNGYGPDFRYQERMKTKTAISAYSVFLGVVALGVVFAIAPLRWLALKFLPKQGEGPSEEMQRTGWFKAQFETEVEGTPVKVLVTGMEPGYHHTSIMLSEAAICLAQDQLPAHGGILTPATALGEPYFKRLSETGMKFEKLK